MKQRKIISELLCIWCKMYNLCNATKKPKWEKDQIKWKVAQSPL